MTQRCRLRWARVEVVHTHVQPRPGRQKLTGASVPPPDLGKMYTQQPHAAARLKPPPPPPPCLSAHIITAAFNTTSPLLGQRNIYCCSSLLPSLPTYLPTPCPHCPLSQQSRPSKIKGLLSGWQPSPATSPPHANSHTRTQARAAARGPVRPREDRPAGGATPQAGKAPTQPAQPSIYSRTHHAPPPPWSCSAPASPPPKRARRQLSAQPGTAPPLSTGTQDHTWARTGWLHRGRKHRPCPGAHSVQPARQRSSPALPIAHLQRPLLSTSRCQRRRHTAAPSQPHS